MTDSNDNDRPDEGQQQPGYYRPQNMQPQNPYQQQNPYAQQQNPYQPYGGPQGYNSPAPTNGLAIASLVTGLGGVFVVPILGSIAAIILGFMARSQIKTTKQQGKGMALAGILLGAIPLALIILGVVALIIVAMTVGFSEGGSSSSYPNA